MKAQQIEAAVVFFNKELTSPPEIEIEIVRRLFTAMPQAGAAAVGLVVISGSLALSTADAWLIAIAVAAVLISAARLWQIAVFPVHRIADLSPDEALRWERGYAALVFIFSMVMGAMTWRVFQIGHVEGELLAACLSIAMTAGASARMQRFWICAVVVSIVGVALILSLLMTGNPLLWLMSAMVALYLASVFESSRHITNSVKALLMAERSIAMTARLDALTGLVNRRAFDEALEGLTVKNDHFGLLLIDLDGFKGVNDRLGHAAGDRLLIEVASRLNTAVAQAALPAIVARLGGDEFAILTTTTSDRPTLERLARACIESVSVEMTLPQGMATVGASIGVKACPPASPARTSDFVREIADAALYRAKRAGKGRVEAASIAGDDAKEAGNIGLHAA